MPASARSLQGNVRIKGSTTQAASGDIMYGAHCEEMDPLACLPFTIIQNTSKSDVLRSASIFPDSELRVWGWPQAE